MSVFITSEDFRIHHLSDANFHSNLKNLHREQKSESRYCKDFLENLKQTDPARVEQLYVQVAKNWKRQTGGLSYETECECGKRLTEFHMDDPFVRNTIVNHIEGNAPELPSASLDDSSEEVEIITAADVFNTKCTIYLPKDPSPTANKHIALAQEAFSFAARHMPFSGNNSRLDPEEIYSPELKNHLFWVFQRTTEIQLKYADRIIPEYLSCMKNEYSNAFTIALQKAPTCEKSIVGNCGEINSIPFFYFLKEKRTDVKIDIFSIRNGNHIFSVIGRNWHSNPGDPSTWGPDAMICEVWDRIIYPATQIFDHLCDYIYCDDFYRPLVQTFDPATHPLILLSTNFYGVGDFQAHSSCSVKTVETMLQEFHSISEQNRDKKIDMARRFIEMLRLSPHATLMENQGLSNLLSQMLHLTGNSHSPINDKRDIWNTCQTALRTNDPDLFRQALETKPPDFNALNHGLCFAQQTGNLEFLRVTTTYLQKNNLKEDAACTFGTFQLALKCSKKTDQLEYLISAVNLGAKPLFFSFTSCLVHTYKTNNLEYLRWGIIAGAEWDNNDIRFIANIALKTQDLMVIRFISTLPQFTDEVKLLLSQFIEENPPAPEFYQEIQPFLTTSSNEDLDVPLFLGP